MQEKTAPRSIQHSGAFDFPFWPRHVNLGCVLHHQHHLLLGRAVLANLIRGVLATRVIPFDGFGMTGGAALPLGGNDKEQEKFLVSLRRVFFEQNITSLKQLTAGESSRSAASDPNGERFGGTPRRPARSHIAVSYPELWESWNPLQLSTLFLRRCVAGCFLTRLFLRNQPPM
jgi:hypothetical protein